MRSKVVQEGFHRYKYAGIIGRRSKNNVTEAETCGDYIGRRGDGNIVNDRADTAVKRYAESTSAAFAVLPYMEA